MKAHSPTAPARAQNHIHVDDPDHGRGHLATVPAKEG